ncbi:unnamed protein product [Arctogadus glacialis]
MHLAGPDHAPSVAFLGAYPGQVMLASPSHQMLAWEHSHPLENYLSSSFFSVSTIIPPDISACVSAQWMLGKKLLFAQSERWALAKCLRSGGSGGGGSGCGGSG